MLFQCFWVIYIEGAGTLCPRTQATFESPAPLGLINQSSVPRTNLWSKLTQSCMLIIFIILEDLSSAG